MTRRRHADSRLLMLQNAHNQRRGERGAVRLVCGADGISNAFDSLSACPSSKSHAIRLGEASVKSENVGIPTL